MALNQVVHLPEGLAGLVARVEALWAPNPGPPDALGRTRRYWNADPVAPFWTTLPTANLPVPPDPDLPGVYLVAETTERMASWTDGPYRVSVLDPSGRLLAGPDDFWIVDADDRGVPTYTADVPGGSLTIYGARFNPASVPATH